MSPDEAAFRADIDAEPFRVGVAQGRWGLLALDWPHALIGVRAAGRSGAPDMFVLRFELTNYRASPPTAMPWDPLRAEKLIAERRPKGERLDMMFRTSWADGNALYIPCDRTAINDHAQWPTQYRAWIWDDSKDITFYLRLVWDRLNAADYRGV